MGEILLNKSYSKLSNSNQGHGTKVLLSLVLCIIILLLLTKHRETNHVQDSIYEYEHEQTEMLQDDFASASEAINTLPTSSIQSELDINIDLDKDIDEENYEYKDKDTNSNVPIVDNKEKVVFIPTNRTNSTLVMFQTCTNESRDLETFYNFLFNRKPKNFHHEPVYSDDLVLFGDKKCILSGKAQIAFITDGFPRCIEFEEINLRNFSKTKDQYIEIKFHVYKVKDNKVHIFPFHTYTLNLFGEESSDYYVYNNMRTIRLCNIGQKTPKFLYENKLWLEISWDPKIQNMICFSKLFYFN